MKVNTSTNTSFKGFYNSKVLKKGLEFAADYGALFTMGTTLVLSSTARTAAIYSAPYAEKENKKVAAAKSVTSSLTGFLMTLALALPVAGAIKNIDKNPQKYLKKESSEFFKNDAKSYSLATQMFKLGLGVIVAVPKAIITSTGLPYVMQSLFGEPIPNKTEGVNPSFKGGGIKEALSKRFGKILDKKSYQNFSQKYKDSNFPMHVIALADTASTATFIAQTYQTDKIKEERKKALIYNSAISTILSIICGYTADKLTQPMTEKFIDKFKKVNKNEPKLSKYVEGIRIAKPVLLLGAIYYTIIPFISTFLAEVADKNPKFNIISSKS